MARAWGDRAQGWGGTPQPVAPGAGSNGYHPEYHSGYHTEGDALCTGMQGTPPGHRPGAHREEWGHGVSPSMDTFILPPPSISVNIWGPCAPRSSRYKTRGKASSQE